MVAEAPLRLTRLIGDDDAIAAPAVRALVNLAGGEEDGVGPEEELDMDSIDDAPVRAGGATPGVSRSLIAALLQRNVMQRLMDSLRDEDCGHKRDVVLLLVNLTRTDEGCEAFVGIEQGAGAGAGAASAPSSTRGHNLRRLVQVLAASPVQGGGAGAGAGGGSAAAASKAAQRQQKLDEFEYVSHVIANTTRLQPARAILLEPERRILPSFFPHLHHSPSTVRRQGVAAAIRNLCLEVTGVDEGGASVVAAAAAADAAAKAAAAAGAGSEAAAAAPSSSAPPPLRRQEVVVNYFLAPSVDLIQALLYPLAGPVDEIPADLVALLPQKIQGCDDSKQREPDAKTRRSLLESLLVLASASRAVREHMRRVRAYNVVKCFHEWLEGDANPARRRRPGKGGPTLDDDGKEVVEADEEEEEELGEDDEATVDAINKLVQQLYREDEVPFSPSAPKVRGGLLPAGPNFKPGELRLDSPPPNATKPTIDLETATGIARRVANNSGVSDEEAASLVTPPALGWGKDE